MFKRIITSKKFKNLIITLIEIAIVAAIILGGLNFIQSKLQSTGGNNVETSDEEKKEEGDVADSEEEEAGDEYYIEANIKKNALIIYQYNKDKSAKTPIKVMKASIGSNVEPGKKKIRRKYTWINTENEHWNKFCTGFGVKGWLMSVDYSDKYDWTLVNDSYSKVGKEHNENSNILLYTGDAQWIFENCNSDTVIKVVKGKKTDELPMEFEAEKALIKACGWDPTQTSKNNPYSQMKNDSIVAYKGTIYVEKGSQVDYLANVIALDSKGKNAYKRIKYSNIDTSYVGKHKVDYTYKPKSGKKEKVTLKYEVIDTTVPTVRVSQFRFTYEVKNDSDKVLKNKKVKSDIESLVRSHASASEGSIKVSTVPEDQLVIGDNYVYVVATDQAGNVGTANAVVEIKVQKEKTTKKEKETTKKNSKGEKETTKKKKPSKNEEETTKKKKPSKKEKETTKKPSKGEKETTKKEKETTTKKAETQVETTKESVSNNEQVDNNKDSEGGNAGSNN